ncbi:hypothetical protein EPUL_002539, partial [Erysiphe pulchra]
MMQIVDVVTEMKNGHYIKCKRIDESAPEPSNIGQNDYGYECGHDLFSHEVVQTSAALAQSYDGGSKLYRKPYEGPLYRPELGYMIYPLSRERNQHHPARKPENTYFVVISPTGEIIDVIAELMHKDFIKCVRTTKVPPIIYSDNNLRFGYSCGIEFFEINHLRQTARLARARYLELSRRLNYPKSYSDVPRPFLHFAIMDLRFNVKYAAVETEKGIKPCEESIRGIETAPPEKDDFICGHNNVEFKNKKLLEVVEVACKALGTRSKRYPANYNGPAFSVHGPYVTMPIRDGKSITGQLLYDLELGYWKVKIPDGLSSPKSIPRASKGPGSDFHVIFDQMRQIVDVVAEMKNGHYIRCKRVDESTPEPSNIDQNDYGYECGHDLFSHEVVKRSADLALSYVGSNKLYLNLYQGPLYWPGNKYFIYPLSRDKNQHNPGKKPENTYFVVISPTREIIDVIAELVHGDFMKCVRTTKVPPNIESDDDLRLGYLCGPEFFEISHMRKTAKLAMARKLQQGKLVFPKLYGDVACPIKHFIVMDSKFNVKYAAVEIQKGKLKPCYETLRGIETAPPETDDFVCQHSNTKFKNKILLSLVDIACSALGSSTRKYPAEYNGPEFNVHGPYVTMPIRYEIGVQGPPTKFRIVMNTECMLAGVIA